MPLDIKLLRKVEDRVRSAEAMIRRLQEENQRLAEQLELSEIGGSHPVGEIPGPSGAPVHTLLEERASIQNRIHRVLQLLDRIHP